MLNRASLIGHLGGDPEIRSTTSGTKVASFSIATSERWTDKATGEKKEKTDWHRVVVWNDRLIPIVEQYLKKGGKVFIEGQIKTRKWSDQSGVDRYSTEIVLQGFDSKITMLDGKGSGVKPAESPEEYGAQDTGRPASEFGAQDTGRPPRDFDDEIPF